MLERVMIISGESSGELYGSLLAKELFARNPDLKIIGVGGEKMLEAGVSLISTVSGSFGLIETLKTFKKTLKNYKTVIDTLRTFRPDILVLIDFPDFNLKVAKKAKEYGIKILYYVSPQIWAWRYNRIKIIEKLVDKIALILPFEEDIYRKANIPHEFVGHPIMDEIKEFFIKHEVYQVNNIDKHLLEIKPLVKKEIGLDTERPAITIMLGSRSSEIIRLFNVLLDFVKAIREKYPDYQILIPVAPNLDGSLIKEIKTQYARYDCIVLYNDPIRSLLASDVAVITSGTATLQAALLGIPMVVVYKLSPLTYFLGKRLIKVKNISIVNLILDYLGKADYKVKELLQRDVNQENIMNEIRLLIEDSFYKSKILKGLEIVRRPFLDKEASKRVAKIIEELSG
jgi:lipid-A-disaccharide synthase